MNFESMDNLIIQFGNHDNNSSQSSISNQSNKRKLEDDTEEYLNTKRIHSTNDKMISEQQQQYDLSPLMEDKMMIEQDEFTDEDEVLKTPSYCSMHDYFIPVNVDVDLDEGGYTGELERGWSDMVNDMYYIN